MSNLDRFFEMAQDARGVLVVTRSETPFASLAEVELAYSDVIARVAGMAPRSRALLVDLRRAPARNDPDFERVIAPLRKRLFAGFARRGVLVSTASGRLQVQRHALEDGHVLEFFTSYGQAISTLSAPSMRPA